MTTRAADGSADGFCSVTTPAYRCVWFNRRCKHRYKSQTVQAMISLPTPAPGTLGNPRTPEPLRLSFYGHVAPCVSSAKTNLPGDSCHPRSAWARGGGRPHETRGKEKGPGSAFGPESIPLATGLVSVVY